MSGVDLMRRIRATPALRSLFVVALTGCGSPQDIATTFEAGFDGHLVKPVAPEALLRLLERVSPQRHHGSG
jgi:CheY-like chemotaxis protein